MATQKKKQQLTYKVVVMGDQYCGKTSIIQRYVRSTYRPTYLQTQAGDCFTKDVDVNGLHVTLVIIDTAGQVNLHSVIRSLYRNAHGIILVFDFSRKKTLKSISDWLTLIKMNCVENPEVLLIGNKIDLHESKREVSEEESDEVGLEHGVQHEVLKVSAKTNTNIEKAFTCLAEQLVKVRGLTGQQLQNYGSISIHKDQTDKHSKCCS